MQKMEQRLATLENRLRNRSRSPRRQQNQRALPAPSQHPLMPPQQMLALLASGTQQKGKSKGQKGSKGKGKGNKTQSSNSSSTQGFRNFQALCKKTRVVSSKTLPEGHMLEIPVKRLPGCKLPSQTRLRWMRQRECPL